MEQGRSDLGGKNGLIEGKADGMAYESWVTREQMVIFLQRLATILKKEK